MKSENEAVVAQKPWFWSILQIMSKNVFYLLHFPDFIMTRVGLTSFHVSGVNPDKPKHNSEMLTIISYGLFEFLVSRLAVGSYSSRYYHWFYAVVIICIFWLLQDILSNVIIPSLIYSILQILHMVLLIYIININILYF